MRQEQLEELVAAYDAVEQPRPKVVSWNAYGECNHIN